MSLNIVILHTNLSPPLPLTPPPHPPSYTNESSALCCVGFVSQHGGAAYESFSSSSSIPLFPPPLPRTPKPPPCLEHAIHSCVDRGIALGLCCRGGIAAIITDELPPNKSVSVPTPDDVHFFQVVCVYFFNNLVRFHGNKETRGSSS